MMRLGRSLEIHGTSTGFDAAFDVSLTSVSSGQPVSFQSNSSLPSGVLFAVGGLNPTDETTARVVNRAGNLTVDRAVYSAPVGAEGCVAWLCHSLSVNHDPDPCASHCAALRASLTETVLDETSPAITYSGTWESNSGEFFYGGSTTYTNEDGAAFAFNFTGCVLLHSSLGSSDEKPPIKLADRRPCARARMPAQAPPSISTATRSTTTAFSRSRSMASRSARRSRVRPAAAVRSVRRARSSARSLGSGPDSARAFTRSRSKTSQGLITRSLVRPRRC